jgi:hypothetical protein
MKKRWLTFLTTSCLAGAALALQITPTYQIFTVKPGQKIQGECTVLNNEGEKLELELSSKDWFVLPDNAAFKAKEWLTFQERKFSLNPGQSSKVAFFVEAPKKAKGELVGMMSYSFNGEIPTNVQKVLSVAIYGAVAGTEVMKGNVKSTLITPSSGTLSVSLLIRNLGNVHIRPAGTCQIEDSKGQPVANMFFTQTSPIYPGKEGAVIAQVKDLQLKPGTYKAAMKVTDVDRKIDVIVQQQKFDVLENGSIDMR